MIIKTQKNSYLIVLISLVAILFSCQKDDVLNDHDLFSRLSKKGGNWKVMEYQYYDNSIPNSTKTTIQPNDEFMRFFRRSFKTFNGAIIDLDYVAIYKGNSYYQLAFGAEKERVVFDYTSFSGESWTVVENKNNKQIWNYVSGDSTTLMTLERCSVSDFPDVPIETGG